MSRPYDAATPALPHAGRLSLLSLLDRYIVQPLLALHRGRVAQRELMALDDRQLADIGLQREEIELALTAPHRVASRRLPTTERSPANTNERARNAA